MTALSTIVSTMQKWCMQGTNTVREGVDSVRAEYTEELTPSAQRMLMREFLYTSVPRQRQLAVFFELFLVAVEASQMRNSWRDHRALWRLLTDVAEDHGVLGLSGRGFDRIVMRVFALLECQGFSRAQVRSWRERVCSLYRPPLSGIRRSTPVYGQRRSPLE
jgi:hypothetical protein